MSKNRKTEDLYDLAEIVISKKNNLNLLNQIKSALKSGVNFLDLAQQVSISSSAKFKGKVGWKNYQNLPRYIRSKKFNLNEGDIISFPTKDKIKIFRNQKIESREKIQFINNLKQIGYRINFKNKDYIIKAFQRRFRQNLINEKIDKECLLISKSLIKSL